MCKFILIFTVLFLILFIYATVNLLRKVEMLQDENEDLNNSLIDHRLKVEAAYRTMTDLDHRGAFQSDDEVGSVFESMKKAVEEAQS